MQQKMNRKSEDTMISMEEYLRKRNVIKGREPEEQERGKDLHSRGRKEPKGEEAGKGNNGQWYSMLALAELMLI
ncbi:hypothetical protein [Schaedlerella sp.]|uniref:hypothetical protein n=1 Tax=Schaedlerella sp. TaxID=2676057 RepID=UPI00261D8200|nr:hypothetical protein [uncultured Schaedlerella sp.]MCI9328549.1 hypothetical protein [Ruminococcus sp.]